MEALTPAFQAGVAGPGEIPDKANAGGRNATPGYFFNHPSPPSPARITPRTRLNEISISPRPCDIIPSNPPPKSTEQEETPKL